MRPKSLRNPADKAVADAINLQDGLDEHQSEADLATVLDIGGDASDAYLFYTSGVSAELQGNGSNQSNTNPVPGTGPLSAQALARAELEALVLADRPADKIAKVVGLSPGAVTAYEQFFFDVRDRLDRPGWISANVIGSLFDTSPLVLLPNLIRAYGYYTRSVRVVRTLVGGFDQAIARRAGRDPGRFFGADALTAGGLKAALAIRMMDVTNPKVFGRVIELHHEAADLEVKRAGVTGGGSEAEDKFKAAFAIIRGKIDRGYQEEPIDVHMPPSSSLKIVTDNDIPDAQTG